MSRARRVFMTGFWTVGGQGLNVLSQLLLIPFFLKAWGEGTYSDWIALTALTSFLQYADGGMQVHVVNVLTAAATRERWDDFQRDLSSATLMYLLASGLALAGTGIICAWLFFSGHFDGRSLQHEAVGVAALLGAQVTIQLLTGFLTGIYRALGRADLMQLATFLVRAALLTGTLVFLWFGRWALAVAALQLGVYGLAMLALAWDVHRRDPHIAFSLRRARTSRAVEFVEPSLRFLLVSLAQGLTQQGTILVLDRVAPTALVQFTTTRTVASAVRQIVALFTNSAWPELTRLDAQGDREKLALAVRLLAKLSCAVSLPVIATLFFTAIPLYEVWTRGRALPNEVLMRLLLIEVLVTVPWYALTFVLTAVSRIKEISNLYITAGVATVILCIVAAKVDGVDGVGVVLVLVSVCVFNVLVPRWAMDVMGRPPSDYLKVIWLPYLALTVVIFAVAWAANLFASWAFVHLGLNGLLVRLSQHLPRLSQVADVLGQTTVVGIFAALAAASLSWKFFFTQEEKGVLKRATRSVLGRRRGAVGADQ